jgi:hypothetical protein
MLDHIVRQAVEHGIQHAGHAINEEDRKNGDNALKFTVLGGMLGAFFGPIGAIAGAVVGAAVGRGVKNEE